VGALGVSIPTTRAEEISDQVITGVLQEAEAMSTRLGRPAVVREA
jgi:DNA-binding IclR family transcriptional regulator